MQHEAIQLAKKCYTGRKVKTTYLTHLAQDDPSSAAMAGFLAKLDATQKAIKQ